MDLGQPGNEKNDAIGVAKKKGKTEVVSLLERFKANPDQTRSEIRKELGWFGEAAEIFALVVFLCDGLAGNQRGEHDWSSKVLQDGQGAAHGAADGPLSIVWWDSLVRIFQENRGSWPSRSLTRKLIDCN